MPKGKISPKQLSTKLQNQINNDNVIRKIVIPQTDGSVRYTKIASYINNVSTNNHAELMIYSSDGYSAEKSRSGMLSISSKPPGKIEYLQMTVADEFFEVGYVVKGTTTEVWLKLAPYSNGTAVIMNNIGITLYDKLTTVTAMSTGYTVATKQYFYNTLNKPTLDDLGGMRKGPLTWNDAMGLSPSLSPLSWDKLEVLGGSTLTWTALEMLQSGITWGDLEIYNP